MFLVAYLKDEYFFPMGLDPDCDGALCSSDTAPAIFLTRAAAKRAIDISKKWAALLKAKGRVHNEDLLESPKFIRIIECVVVDGNVSKE